MSSKRFKDWLNQAENDLNWARDSLNNKYYSQTCFISQQLAEKSLKALAYKQGYDLVKTHSIVKILAKLNINGELKEIGKLLDQYYITSRYPDSLPEGAPFEFFTKKQAEEALIGAETIFKRAKNECK